MLYLNTYFWIPVTDFWGKKLETIQYRLPKCLAPSVGLPTNEFFTVVKCSGLKRRLFNDASYIYKLINNHKS